MADTKGASSFRNSAATGKQSFLPPKSPLPTISPSYANYSFAHCIGPKGIPRPRDGHKHHQRTSSESFILEEQPSWLDDLLNEPETPVRRGAHRRSSSDSFAYLDTPTLSLDNLAQEGYRHRSITSLPSWGSGELDYLNDVQHPAYYTDSNSFGGSQSRGWDPAFNTATYPSSSRPSTKEKAMHQGSSCAVKEPGPATSVVAEKHDNEESSQDPKDSFERREDPHGKHPQSEMDNKRVKQQFAQRSRVRKLQYIAELEKNVQALQAEALGVSSELGFLNQQNLMLDLENKALKQRLDSLAQEHLIKCVKHEMLEREAARLRALLFQQQQQPTPTPTPTHGRRNSRDLDTQFANLSLKHREANSGGEPVTGPLRI